MILSPQVLDYSLPAGLDASSHLRFPLGIIGFPEFKEAAVSAVKEEEPFCRMREAQPVYKVEFILVNPFLFFDDYQLDINPGDLEDLSLNEKDAFSVMNIVAIQQDAFFKRISINLLAPILINKKTLGAKQVILLNSDSYSTKHLLFETPLEPEEAKANTKAKPAAAKA